MTIKEKKLSEEVERLKEKVKQISELHQDMFQNYIEAQNKIVVLKNRLRNDTQES